MSLTTHVMPHDEIGEIRDLPAAIMAGAVLLFGLLAVLGANLDMGHAVAALLIGP